MRLFAAVWPPEDVLDHLDLALGAVRRTLPGDRSGPVRWSARETWHLTCAFYGDVPGGRVPELVAGLAEGVAPMAPYPLRLRGAGVFAHRTLWVGVGGDTGAQLALTRGAVAAGEAAGVRPDDRPRERAHLTIGRVRVSERRPGQHAAPGRPDGTGPPRARDGWGDGADPIAPEALVGALSVYEGPEWTVEAVQLVASWPGQGRGGGPRYAVVEELRLGTG